MQYSAKNNYIPLTLLIRFLIKILSHFKNICLTNLFVFQLILNLGREEGWVFLWASPSTACRTLTMEFNSPGRKDLFILYLAILKGDLLHFHKLKFSLKFFILLLAAVHSLTSKSTVYPHQTIILTKLCPDDWGVP